MSIVTIKTEIEADEFEEGGELTPVALDHLKCEVIDALGRHGFVVLGEIEVTS